MVFISQSSKKKSEEYWAAGTGYGHNKRPGDLLVILQITELAYMLCVYIYVHLFLVELLEILTGR